MPKNPGARLTPTPQANACAPTHTHMPQTKMYVCACECVHVKPRISPLQVLTLQTLHLPKQKLIFVFQSPHCTPRATARSQNFSKVSAWASLRGRYSLRSSYYVLHMLNFISHITYIECPPAHAHSGNGPCSSLHLMQIGHTGAHGRPLVLGTLHKHASQHHL